LNLTLSDLLQRSLRRRCVRDRSPAANAPPTGASTLIATHYLLYIYPSYAHSDAVNTRIAMLHA